MNFISFFLITSKNKQTTNRIYLTSYYLNVLNTMSDAFENLVKAVLGKPTTSWADEEDNELPFATETVANDSAPWADEINNLMDEVEAMSFEELETKLKDKKFASRFNYKSKWCNYGNNCKNINSGCTYAHDENELRQDFCPYLDDCKFRYCNDLEKKCYKLHPGQTVDNCNYPKKPEKFIEGPKQVNPSVKPAPVVKSVWGSEKVKKFITDDNVPLPEPRSLGQRVTTRSSDAPVRIVNMADIVASQNNQVVPQIQEVPVVVPQNNQVVPQIQEVPVVVPQNNQVANLTLDQFLKIIAQYGLSVTIAPRSN